MIEEIRSGYIHSIYTDGSHCPETNTGGWGVIVCYQDGSIREFGGSVPNTSISQMELYAAINALKFLSESGQSERVTIYIDCDSLKEGVTRLLPIWKKNNWRNKQGRPIRHQDLWQLIDASTPA
jgi:ribonuclease HI